MEALIKRGTAKTPHVFFDSSMGILDLRGRSNPGNSLEFYQPLIDWVKAYTRESVSKTRVNVQLEYFNTSSSKCLLDLFRALEDIPDQVVIQWYYEPEDEDMLEAGEDYEAIIKIPFKMIALEAMNEHKRAAAYTARMDQLNFLRSGAPDQRSFPPLSV